MREEEGWLRRWFEARGPIPGATAQAQLEANYFEAGLIDSLSVVALVADIEEAFGVRFEERHYLQPRFSTIGGLAAIVAELTAAGPGRPSRSPIESRRGGAPAPPGPR